MFMFSPILAIRATNFSSIVVPSSNLTAFNSSTVETGLFKAVSTNNFPKFLNSSFLATKSVSALNSITTAVLWSAVTPSNTNPSAAILPAFLTAFAIPFSLR